MAKSRKTTYFGTGQGLITGEFIGNAGCIHPIDVKHRGMEMRSVVAVGKKVDDVGHQIEGVMVMHASCYSKTLDRFDVLEAEYALLDMKLSAIIEILQKPWWVKVWDWMRGKRGNN